MDLDGVVGPVKDVVIEPEYLDVSVPPGASFSHPIRKGHTVLAYLINGEGHFDKGNDAFAYEIEGANYFDFKRECLMKSGSLVMFADGDEVLVTTKDQPVRFLLVSGRPLNEPVAWYGPIVMNTREELRVAFEEFNNGTFIKSK